MERYSVKGAIFMGTPVAKAEKDSGGKYVLYADHEAEMQRLRDENRRLITAIQFVRTCDDGDCLPCKSCMEELRRPFQGALESR
jgi:hypothetical protein